MMEKICYERDSADIYAVLDKLGYSKPVAEKRVAIYRNSSKGDGLYERIKFKVDYDVLIAGSRGDGTGIYIDSDVDKLLIQNHLECIENEHMANIKTNRNITMFELETEDAPSGYAYLRFIKTAENQEDELHRNILDALEDRNGKQYLRNDCTLSPGIGREYTSSDCGWIEDHLVHSKTKSGPSKPYKIQTPFVPMVIILDDVLAFKCVSSKVKDAWCNRTRTKCWPSTGLIELVRNLDVYVVPVGLKGSQDEHLQWRICFTQAELTLVQSFNDVQIKLLGALKLITKHHLTPICSNITSYIIKTILLWQMEQENCNEWYRQNFNIILADILIKLKTCIEKEQLSNYMIPERNMFQDKITQNEKVRLIEKLDAMTDSCLDTLIKQCVLLEIVEADIGDITDEIKEKMKALKEKNLFEEVLYKSPKAVSGSEQKDGNQQLEDHHSSQDATLSKDEENLILQTIPKRRLREQFVLAIFALDPEKIATVLKQIFEVKQPSDIIEIISTEVFPYIREHNPYGFFHELISRKESEILSFCAESKASETSCVLL